MALLEKHKDLKPQQQKEIQKQHEWGIIGRQVKRPGLTLYAYDTEKKEIYVVDIEKKEAIDLKQDVHSTRKAHINPKHPMLWCLNINNAKRKFNNALGLNLKL